MIRLKSLLIESAVAEKKLNVLFVTDNDLDKRRGFARELISDRIINGQIYTANKGSISKLKEIVENNASFAYDLIVVFFRGVYEQNVQDNIQRFMSDLQELVTFCKSIDTPLVLNTVPTAQFIKPEVIKKLNLDVSISEHEGVNRIVDDWITDNADYVLDAGKFNDDIYFDRNNASLERPAHVILYDDMLNILNSLDSSIDVEAASNQMKDNKLNIRPGYIGASMEEIHDQLIRLGYEIDPMERLAMEYGGTTSDALRVFKMKHGLNASDIIDDDTMKKLRSAKLQGTKQKKKQEVITSINIPAGVSSTQADNIKLIIQYMQDSGIEDLNAQIAILSVIGKETGFLPRSEDSFSTTSNSHIRDLFGARVPSNDAALNALKADDEAFFNQVYGGRYGNASNEGYLYRGRGFNGLTFKGNYKYYGDLIGQDLVSNPDLVNDPDVAAKVAVVFLTNGNAVKKFNSVEEAVTYFVNVNAGGSASARNHIRANQWAQRFKDAANKE